MVCETCPVCEVVIEDDAVVRFSYGKPGNKERLLHRVCKYSSKPGCINSLYKLNEKYPPSEEGYSSALSEEVYKHYLKIIEDKGSLAS
ncbi:hypothetical protein H6G33_10060 [Calothrix sp. FACHB-1219]|uniref:hypothetical protein n=1 Tax=unclassified Calothrix TaxID=2619626 RepID=UPI0016860818|nr:MULTISPECIES: hypothetical protein [unclassified Calothrix]MBD2201691.1 hypothetical protein [Calothrix sp. FACHB-168]MBD2217377.1 hypothetical protein [Calothrix sp. FACHB-1219]